MKIAVVCHGRHPIREPFAGGLEAHNWHLARGLESLGHEVTLFASGDSDPQFRIVPIFQYHVERTHPGREHAGDPGLQQHVDAGYALACDVIGNGGFDIVHNNSLHRFVLQRAAAGSWPCVTSLHTPPIGGLEWAARAAIGPSHWFTSASRMQRAMWWPDGAPAESVVVPNGIDLSSWPFIQAGDGAAIWSGRITPDKGPHLALLVARLAGVKLTLLGAIEDRAYFDRQVAPLLGPDASYAGQLSGRELAGAIGSASVFLSTPCWPEPFGLGAIEAMACGVPVAAFDLGAVREVVGDEAGRFARAEDVAGLADALRRATTIGRAQVRRRAVGKYGLSAMIARYLAIYDTVREAK